MQYIKTFLFSCEDAWQRDPAEWCKAVNTENIQIANKFQRETMTEELLSLHWENNQIPPKKKTITDSSKYIFNFGILPVFQYNKQYITIRHIQHCYCGIIPATGSIKCHVPIG